MAKIVSNNPTVVSEPEIFVFNTGDYYFSVPEPDYTDNNKSESDDYTCDCEFCCDQDLDDENDADDDYDDDDESDDYDDDDASTNDPSFCFDIHDCECDGEDATVMEIDSLDITLPVYCDCQPAEVMQSDVAETSISVIRFGFDFYLFGRHFYVHYTYDGWSAGCDWA